MNSQNIIYAPRMQEEQNAAHKTPQYSTNNFSGDKLAPENSQNYTSNANPIQQKNPICEQETTQEPKFEDSGRQNQGQNEIPKTLLTEEHPPQPPPTSEGRTQIGRISNYGPSPQQQPVRTEENLIAAGQSQSDTEFNNLIYEITLNQLILDSGDSDSDGTIRTNDTLRFLNSSDDNSCGSNEEKKEDPKKERPVELTGCALYMKHGLIFKKNYRCENPMCDICSNSKLYYRRYVDCYGRESRVCAWNSNKAAGANYKF